MNGMKLHAYANYDEYRKAQQAANQRKINVVWVRQRDVQFIADYIKTRITPKFGICHGTRTGHEQEWFRECLGCEVLGTEIATSASAYRNTICWDFHETKPEWLDAVDFIYSNAFDHAYDPQKALDAWMSCTRLCIIEHTVYHGPKHVSEVDPFGAELQVMPYLITLWGNGRYGVRQILKPTEDRSFIVVERWNTP